MFSGPRIISGIKLVANGVFSSLWGIQPFPNWNVRKPLCRFIGYEVLISSSQVWYSWCSCLSHWFAPLEVFYPSIFHAPEMRQIPTSERRAGRRGGEEGSRDRTSIFCCKQQILIGVGQKPERSITAFFNIEQHRKSPSIRDTTAYESLMFSRKEKNLDVELS